MRRRPVAGSPLQTEFEFTLPRGYVDSQGNLHRVGRMRLARAIDEIAPQRDPSVRDNPAYLSIAILARVITQLGELGEVNVKTVENMFTADLAYLQDFYRRVNENGSAAREITCPQCGTTIQVEDTPAGGS